MYDGRCLDFGPNQEIHDMRLKAVLQRVRSAGITLNRDKCVTLTISWDD